MFYSNLRRDDSGMTPGSGRQSMTDSFLNMGYMEFKNNPNCYVERKESEKRVSLESVEDSESHNKPTGVSNLSQYKSLPEGEQISRIREEDG